MTALAASAVLAFGTGCSTQDDQAEPSRSASPGGARHAVEAYVDALNSRSATGLIEVGGVKDEGWSRKEAARILADRGGKDWKIKDVRIDYDMGPDTGSARLLAEGKAGGSLRDTFTVTREKGMWHLAFLTHQPPGTKGKQSSSTNEPSS